MKNLKWIIYGVVGLYAVYVLFIKSDDQSQSYTTEEVVEPTQGVISYLQQQPDSSFLIADEVTIDNPEDSKVIATYLDNTRDTFSLSEVQAMSNEDDNGHYRSRGIYRGVYWGLMGYWMGRSMSSPVRSSAYMDQNTYNRVNNGAGQNMQRTASRTTRTKPSAGRSGYGGGSSTRSYGG